MDLAQNCQSFLARINHLSVSQSWMNKLIHGSNNDFLETLSSALLQPSLVEPILLCFDPLAVELVARWKSMNHKEAIAALGRILPLVPRLSAPLQDLLSWSGIHVDFLQQLPSLELQQDGMDNDDIRELLLGVLRLVTFDNTGFTRLFRPANLQLYLSHNDRAIRYLAIRILCAFTGASDHAFEEALERHLGDGEISGLWEGKTIDYRFWPLWEEKRQKDFLARFKDSRERPSDPCTIKSRVITNKDMSPQVTSLAGMLFVKRNIDDPSPHLTPSLVLTSTVERNLCHLAQALQRPNPILLTGMLGSGKTHLVEYVSSALASNSSMITLHLNEQTDAKLLVGIYASGSTPGSFEWKPGVLTTAVRQGRWIFIEDLDRAPNEVLSTILPLIEHGQLHLPNRGEVVRAAPGFRIIATMRTHRNLQGDEVLSKQGMLGDRLWTKVHVQELDSLELQQLIEEQYPPLRKLATRLLSVYTGLKLATRNAGKDNAISLSPRSLFRWCTRITAYLRLGKSSVGPESIDEAALDAIFLDAVDCFAGYLEDQDLHAQLASIIAQELHIDPQRKHHLLFDRTIPKKSTDTIFSIGRARIQRYSGTSNSRDRLNAISRQFVLNNHSMRLLERVAIATERQEPVLLVGETGIGKTTVVQYLSSMLGRSLLAINLSQQSESGDLLGGFKPISVRSMAMPLKDEFDILFDRNFSNKKNQSFMQHLSKAIAKGQWKRALSLWREAFKMVDHVLEKNEAPQGSSLDRDEGVPKRRKIASKISDKDRADWQALTLKLDALEAQISTSSSNSLVFAFTEGKLVKAVRDGHWVLLDEINLATPDTLECLSDLLEGGPDRRGSLLLTETGSVERVLAHPDFRIFGAMNPSNDIGKRDLPPGIRSRFTELYVESPDKDVQSLQTIISAYLDRMGTSQADSNLKRLVTETYLRIQYMVRDEGLVDGSDQRPIFSLRTLTRTLAFATQFASRSTIKRALYEGFALCFFTSLNQVSEARVSHLVQSKLFGSPTAAQMEMKKSLKQPENTQDFTVLSLIIQPTEKGRKSREETCWVPKGSNAPQESSNYIITPYIGRNLQNLVRATLSRKYPVLIQGPTSAGKTSMVEYLAQRSGNTFVRINNHEHTDLQEYLGTYLSNSEGQIVFQEGVLVEALRKGYWVVLDELNLAPTDVLEALNRLLDENRELLIPETQEIVRPHPNFMLFATQNPAGPYGGRKQLSRAFRNRFLELHFDDIPVDELQVILSKRANLPESRCALIVEVYKKLSQLRQESRVFEQNSFATLRDLFRWAFRDNDSVEKLAYNGYMLLAEKVRKAEERLEVRKVIEKTMSRKGVKVAISDEILYDSTDYPPLSGVVWTKAMKRLYSLVRHAVEYREAILLVGETGCGKTTVCQMLAHILDKKLFVVNAHQNLETGDLIGAQRPTRNRASMEAQLQTLIRKALSYLNEHDVSITGSNSNGEAVYSQLNAKDLASVPSELQDEIRTCRRNLKTLFEWQDGSIVQAMRSGQFFLLDEISLADDSVLERLNSVLDPQRTILLAEKGATDPLVKAQDEFQFFATMNPGGDYGKKELSPALRNRFTEIWVPPMTDMEDVLQIVKQKLNGTSREIADAIISFSKWFEERFNPLKESSISIRDMLAWVDFINVSDAELIVSVVHGAAMVYIDTIGANPSAMIALDPTKIRSEKRECLIQLSQLLGVDATIIYSRDMDVVNKDSFFSIGGFRVSKTKNVRASSNFTFDAETSKNNAMRVLRGLQLKKPILLEGSPGVGKTSLVVALANAVGKPLTRINLSEQTDLMDLFGSDAPVAGAEAGKFAWRDASFLAAMKSGGWVLLDEMNLASQSVLEGLNACLDHRGEVFIPELNMVFKRHAEFRLFAAQNPHSQGAGRKGLPSSFVNRFSVIYTDVLEPADLCTICERMFPNADIETIQKLVTFVDQLDKQTTLQRRFGQDGAPWEFNLRDTLRMLQLIMSQRKLLCAADMLACIEILVVQRFRSASDRKAVLKISEETLRISSVSRSLTSVLSSSFFQVGLGLQPRSLNLASREAMTSIDISGRHSAMEATMVCVEQNWPVILVGMSAAGKSRLLESLAAVAGRNLQILPLNADIDATDLVGGYEQVDRTRELRATMDSAGAFARRCLVSRIQSSEECSATTWTQLVDVISFEEASPTVSNGSNLLQRISDLSESPWASSFQPLEKKLQNCIEKLQQVEVAHFEWLDGTLISAIENGDWLVLDNANLCSPSVLDRLNSLLESDGVLSINENCATDGKPRTIVPHADFRIFLTMDPRHGEISRAMRNRAVEIFLPYKEHDGTLTLSLESSLLEFHQVMHLSRMPFSEKNVKIMENFFNHQTSQNGLHLMARFKDQLQSGLITNSFAASCIESCGNIIIAVEHGRQFLQLPLAYYEQVARKIDADNTFARSQSLNTLSNSVLVQVYKQLRNDLNPYWLATAYQSFLFLAQFDKALHLHINDAYSQNSGGRIPHGQLTRLQHSFNQRSIKLSKRSTDHVADFFFSTQRELSRFFVQANIAQENVSDIDYWIRQFLFYLDAIFSALSDLNFDEAKYNVIAQQAYDSLAAKDAIVFVSSSSPASSIEKMLSSLRSIIPSSFSRTGLSMNALWSAFHLPTTSSTQRHQNLLKIEAIADQFDHMIITISAPLQDLVALRKSLLQAMELTMEKDITVDLLASNVETALREMINDQNADGFSPLFQPAFLSLIQCFQLREATIDTRQVAVLDDILYLLAGEATKGSLHAGTPGSLPSILNNISKYVGFNDTIEVPPCGGCGPGQTILRQLDMKSQVEARSLPLLNAETILLGREISAKIEILSMSQTDSMRLFARNLAQATVKIHESPDEIPATRTSTDNSLYQKDSAGTVLDYLSVKARYLKPSLSQSQSLENGTAPYESTHPKPKEVTALARTIITVSLALLALYVPEQPEDPALPAIVKHELHEKRVQQMSSEIETLSSLENILTGADTNPKTLRLKAQLERMGIAPNLPMVPRPTASHILTLQPEFSAILRILKHVTEHLLDKNFHSDEMKSTCRDIVGIINRLRGEEYYRDVLQPLIGFLNLLRLGISCAEFGFRSSNIDRKYCQPADMVDTMPLFGNPGALVAIDTEQADGNTRTEDFNYNKHLILSVRLQNRISAFAPLSQQHWTSVTASFSSFYQDWKIQLKRDQEQHAQASKSFTYRGDMEIEAQDEEHELRQLFPDYSSHEHSEEQVERQISNDPRQSAMNAASLHADIFAKKGSQEEALEAVVHHATGRLRVYDPGTDQGIATKLDKVMLGISTIELSELKTILNISEKPTQYNIYADRNVSEMQRAATLAKKISSRVASIRHVWPEHSTLNHIIDTCKDLLSMPFQEPLMKVMQPLEQLHAYLEQWQSVASREFSVDQLISDVVQLIVSWRRLELSTWAQLLDLEYKKCEAQSSEWWFLAFENIIYIPSISNSSDSSPENLAELASSLESFIGGSPVGQFGHRLSMLDSLFTHAKGLVTSHPLFEGIAITVNNIIEHYRRFNSLIDDFIVDGRAKLEKELKDLVQLASWKDTNIESLRQSSRNSHRKLFRVVKKFRELLAKPASPLLTQRAESHKEGTRCSTNRALNDLGTEEDAVHLATNECRKDSRTWVLCPKRYQNPQATVSIMRREATILESAIDIGSTVDDFGENIHAEAEQLRRATPTVSSEGNAASVKHLTTQKRRLLADTLKWIQFMGIGSNHAATILQKQESVSKVLARLPALDESDIGLHAVLDLMSKIRESLNEHHNDLNHAVATRCVGLYEGMLETCITQRVSLEKHISLAARLGQDLQKVKSLWTSTGLSCCTSKQDNPKSLHDASEALSSWAGWMGPAIELAIRILQSQASFGSLDFSNSSLLDELQDWARKFAMLSKTLFNETKTFDNLVTIQAIEAQKEIQQARETFNEQLIKWQAMYPQAFLPLSSLQERVEDLAVYEKLHSKSGRNFDKYEPEFNIEKFHAALFACLDFILGATQDVKEKSREAPESTETRGWLVKGNEVQHAILLDFKCRHFLQRFEKVTNMLGQIDDDVMLAKAAASLTSVAPIISEYHNAYLREVDRYKASYVSLTRNLHRFARIYYALSTSGFCKPSEPSDGEEGDRNEKLESGTGLGEGEGAENISKDIGSDEDLEELAQEENADANPEDQEDGNQDAVSIDGDLKNQKGADDVREEEDGTKSNDADENEEKDDDDEMGSVGDDADAQGTEGQDESNQNMDEGVGEVDDLEPSAVDEKMWDDAVDDQLKEKEGKQDAKSKDKQEQAASKDDAGNKKEDGEAGGDDGDEGSDDISSMDEQEENSEDPNGAGAPEDAEAMDPNVKETENLDLPEDMQLDGDRNEGREEDEEAFEEFPEDAADEDIKGDVEKDDAGDGSDHEHEQEDHVEAGEAHEDRMDMDKEDAMDVNDQTEPAEGDNGHDDSAEKGTGGKHNQSDESRETRDQLTQSENEANADDSVADPQTATAAARGDQQSQPSTAQHPAANEDAPKEQQDEEAIQQPTENRFKKLGDILEQWHRQQREIQEASSADQGQQEQQDIDMADADFEHLPEEDAKADTQALGASKEEDARALDQTLALPSEDKPDDEQSKPDNFEADEAETDADAQAEPGESEDEVMAESGQDPDSLQRQTRIGSPSLSKSQQRHDEEQGKESTDKPPSEELSALDIRAAPVAGSSESSQWSTYEAKTWTLALGLTGQLRLILTPTLATKLRGDFRTGKRLNIKRIIPYIASSYKRDKIWMRRSVPSKRAYQILLCIDDSKSMQGPPADLAFQTLALVARALAMLEAGEIGVLCFGQDVTVAHPLGQALTSAAGEALLRHFSFAQDKTDVGRLVASAIEQLRSARTAAGPSAAELWQLQLIVSDGICENHEGIRRLLLKAQEERIMVVFIVIDADASGRHQKDNNGNAAQKAQSIADLERVEFVQEPARADGAMGEMRVVRQRYLDTFPFGYYLIVKDVAELPGVLSAALRQWFAEVAER